MYIHTLSRRTSILGQMPDLQKCVYITKYNRKKLMIQWLLITHNCLTSTFLISIGYVHVTKSIKTKHLVFFSVCIFSFQWFHFCFDTARHCHVRVFARPVCHKHVTIFYDLFLKVRWQFVDSRLYDVNAILLVSLLVATD